MTDDSVVLINAFEVPAGSDEAFLEGWERARAFLSSQEGYLSTQLHRSLTTEADFRFINFARWGSAKAFGAATSQPGFRDVTIPFPFHASVYEVVHTDTP